MHALHQDLITLANTLADLSADVIRPLFRAGVEIDDKCDASPVTRADRDAEAVMRAHLRAVRPDDGIIGEEFGEERADAEWVWVLDPIDGTKSFTVGRAQFVTLIGLLHHGVPVYGVIHQPVTNERWQGGLGQPARLNEAVVQVGDCQRLEEARLACTGPELLGDALGTFLDMVADARFAVWGGDGYLYGQLASGWLELVVENGLKLYDVAALAPVVTAAGGVMTDWQGRALDRHTASSGRVVAACSASLHAQALARLASVASR
ncbi:inositol monophosphatase family protein [Chitinibacteraceae bacterium HSL-7]